MKTAKERAVDYVEKYWISNKQDFIKGLTLLLKEQDKITRHACADAIIKIGGYTIGSKAGIYINKDKAHSEIMNVQAV